MYAILLFIVAIRSFRILPLKYIDGGGADAACHIYSWLSRINVTNGECRFAF